jgi:DNA-binding winged helix-turn-helix (wHTH) protein
MDQILSNCLQFDRFTLDLARGTLRVGGEEIALRPKAFEVLRHLAENAGRLVLKQELHEAVWPCVTVTDDSLVQCIRELRQMLGDEERSLIKTVSRRGYLLNAEPRVLTAQPVSGGLAARSTEPPSEDAPRPDTRQQVQHTMGGRKRNTMVVLALLCITLGAAFLLALNAPPTGSLALKPARVPAVALNNLFSNADYSRIAEIAQSKQLPIPVIEFDRPDDDVPLAIRRFIGIWVSNKGFVNSNRQFMFIVNHVEKEGLAGGWTVRGPPAPSSLVQNPAAAVPVIALISDNALTYRNPRGDYKVWFAEQGGLVFKETFVTGVMTMVALDPIWTLVEAERAVASKSVAP